MARAVRKRKERGVKSEIQFEDMEETHMVTYLLENTESIVSTKDRLIRITYKQVGAYFNEEHLLLHKLVSMHAKNVTLAGI